MPPKDSTAADLSRLEKSVADNASGVGRLEAQALTVATDISDLKAAIAQLNQGMQLLLTDRQNSSKGSGASTNPKSSASMEAAIPGNLLPPVTAAPPPSPRHTENNTPRQTTTHRLPFQNTQTVPPYKIPKVDFPQFNRSRVRSWLHKAHRFFLVHPIPPEQKVVYASLLLHGKAEDWYATEAALFERMPWEEIAYLVNACFSEEICENVVGQFSKLLQIDSVQDYVEKFEELRPLMLQRKPGLTESSSAGG